MTEAEPSSVLVVDDDDDLREIMALLVESLDVRCFPARSLTEVRALGPRLKSCTLALLDVNLGGGEPTGIEVRDWLRENGYTGPAVFLTGHGQDLPGLGDTLGPRDKVLSKPIDSDVLVRLVRETTKE
jgi:FixJ family two-component response regulator